jgi:hypothetical protein
MTAPSSAFAKKTKSRPESELEGEATPSTSGIQQQDLQEQQDKTFDKWSSNKQLALTNGVCGSH